MHRVLQPAGLEKCLDLGHLLGDRGCARPDLLRNVTKRFLFFLGPSLPPPSLPRGEGGIYRDEAEVDVALLWRGQVGDIHFRDGWADRKELLEKGS